MNLMSTLFAHKGRLAPAEFQRAGFVLIGMSFLIALSPLFLPFRLSITLSILGLLLVWPWACLWSRRFHDAGQSGWLFLAVLVLYLALNFAMNQILSTIFGGEAARMAQAAVETGDFRIMMEAMRESAVALAPSNAIGSGLISVVMVLGANAILKSDPEENRYGPPV